jgi:hypothetical protein
LRVTGWMPGGIPRNVRTENVSAYLSVINVWYMLR